jgi:hypothetical protein
VTGALAALGVPRAFWIVLLVISVLLGVLAIVRYMEERADRASERFDQRSEPSTFARLRGVEGFHSEENESDAERFIDAEDSSSVSTRKDVHRSHGKAHEEEGSPHRSPGGDHP